MIHRIYNKRQPPIFSRIPEDLESVLEAYLESERLDDESALGEFDAGQTCCSRGDR